MGYSTFFEGALRITPKVDIGLACRLNLWFRSRHYDRKTVLDKLIGNNIDMNDMTLFGKPGNHNEFYMPSFRKAIENLIADGMNPIIAPHKVGDTYKDAQDESIGRLPHDVYNAYNTTPDTIPSLWSDIIIVNDPNENMSYLSWSRQEKSYDMETWLNAVVNLLQNLHYTVEGCIKAQGEDECDRWCIEVLSGEKLMEEIDAFAREANIHEYDDLHNTCSDKTNCATTALSYNKTENVVRRFNIIETNADPEMQARMTALKDKVERFSQYGESFHTIQNVSLNSTYWNDMIAAIKSSEYEARKPFDPAHIMDAILQLRIEERKDSE